MQSNNLGVFKRQKWITGRFSCLSFLCRFTCALHHVAHSVAAFVVFNSEWWLKYACATRYLAVLWTICESATEFARNAFSVLFPGTRWSSVWLDFCVWIIRMVRDLGCCEQHENEKLRMSECFQWWTKHECIAENTRIRPSLCTRHCLWNWIWEQDVCDIARANWIRFQNERPSTNNCNAVWRRTSWANATAIIIAFHPSCAPATAAWFARSEPPKLFVVCILRVYSSPPVHLAHQRCRRTTDNRMNINIHFAGVSLPVSCMDLSKFTAQEIHWGKRMIPRDAN